MASAAVRAAVAVLLLLRLRVLLTRWRRLLAHAALDLGLARAHRLLRLLNPLLLHVLLRALALDPLRLGALHLTPLHLRPLNRPLSATLRDDAAALHARAAAHLLLLLLALAHHRGQRGHGATPRLRLDALRRLV